ncbi:MAG: tyrosine-protein phosphatase [Treponema sp.]|jgi:protein tyrosine/serine phosphatase|nr:tyrosine-protein phosphatase [Treponema sp.]
MKKLTPFFIAVLFVFSLYAQRNIQWASPVESSHVKNFYKIDEGVYRSAQPNTKAFAELEKMGISEILNLRYYFSDRNPARNSSLILHQVKMHAGNSKWEELVKALRIIKNRKGPIVIHCWHGSDRTGIVCALYRLVFQDWTKEEAIDELENGGYGYHSGVYSNIKTFIQNVDVATLKNALNL